MKRSIVTLLVSSVIVLLVSLLFTALAENPTDLDARVKNFLDTHNWPRGDSNVPPVDGQTLYDIIVKNKYKSALEIGTSSGHSGIWIGWALSKTGGRLITVEIDEQRHREALMNFKAAGVSEFIDARLGNAHELVPALEGPFDFVFSDADKDWYKNYFIAVLPKLEVGGCYTTHNMSSGRRGGRRGRGGRGGSNEYLDYLKSLPNVETSVDSKGGGIAISYKRSD